MIKKILLITLLFFLMGNAFALPDQIWDKNWTTPGNGADQIASLAVGLDGNLYVGGYGTNMNGSSSSDWWLKKIDPNGAQIWDKNWANAGTSIDRISSLAVGLDGNLYVGGYGAKGSTSTDWWLKKIDPNGTQIWDKNWTSAGAFADQIKTLLVGSDGNLYVGGYGNKLAGLTGADWWLKKINPSGTQIWDMNWATPGNNPDQIAALAVGLDGNLYVGGLGYLMNGASNYDWWLKKINPSGTQIWDKNWTTPGNNSDQINSLIVGLDGNLYAGGNGTKMNGSSGTDWWLKKINPIGTQIWDMNWTTPGAVADWINSLIIETDGNLYVGGYGTNMNGTSGNDWWLKKIDPSGTQIWDKNWAAVGNSVDQITALAVGLDGNLYVGGYGTNMNGTSGNDWWLKKLIVNETIAPVTDECVRPINVDWVITTYIDCYFKTINLGTGQLILNAGGRLRLYDSDVTTKNLVLNVAGNLLYLFAHSFLKVM